MDHLSALKLADPNKMRVCSLLLKEMTNWSVPDIRKDLNAIVVLADGGGDLNSVSTLMFPTL